MLHTGLRHTHASLMLRRGVPLEVVSEKLGHSRPSFTADVYRTVYQSEHEEWAVNLSDLTVARPRVINEGRLVTGWSQAFAQGSRRSRVQTTKTAH